MRKHGLQLPYHPLQAVAIAVFLALGFAFYVFFVPFIRNKALQYVVMGLYTPLATCVFCLYVWCAAANPSDPGIFRSKKHLKVDKCGGQILCKEFEQEGSEKEVIVEKNAKKDPDGGIRSDVTMDESRLELESERIPCYIVACLAVALSWCGLSFMCNWCLLHEESSEQQMSEEGMFYCSLCEVEVLKYSKALQSL